MSQLTRCRVTVSALRGVQRAIKRITTQTTIIARSTRNPTTAARRQSTSSHTIRSMRRMRERRKKEIWKTPVRISLISGHETRLYNKSFTTGILRIIFVADRHAYFAINTIAFNMLLNMLLVYYSFPIRFIDMFFLYISRNTLR